MNERLHDYTAELDHTAEVTHIEDDQEEIVLSESESEEENKYEKI